jgi:hypothetical protein
MIQLGYDYMIIFMSPLCYPMSKIESCWNINLYYPNKPLTTQELSLSSLAVNCRLPTTAVWVQSQFRSCGVCGGLSCTGVGFLQVLQFPQPILIPLSTQYSSMIGGWCGGPISGLCIKWTLSYLASHNITGWYSSNTLDFYSGSTHFESQVGHQLS